jgi:hypothetical protein
MTALSNLVRRAAAAAETLTGKRFGIFVASSLVATSAIVAAAMTSSNGVGPLAGVLGRSLAADTAPAAAEAAPKLPTKEAASGGSAKPTAGGGTASSVPSLAPAPPPAPVEAPAPESEAPAPLPEVALPEAGQVKHVFVISLSSPGYEAAFGATPQMPYLAGTLRPQGQLLSNYSLLDDAATANSIAAVSGQRPNPQTAADCPTWSEFPPGAKVSSSGVVSGSGCVYPVEALTLADQLASGRFSWRAYMEGMSDETGTPANCVHPEAEAADAPATGGYSARLNPFTHFHSLLDLGDCATNDVPLSELQKDLRKLETTPNYSYISPDLCDAGVAGQCPAGAPEGAASADAFLAAWVPKILASPAYKQDGLLVVTFNSVNPPPPPDPANPTPAPAPAAPLRVGTLLLSQFVSPGATDPAAYDPYSLLRSTDELFGLSPLAAAGGSKVKSFAPALLGENGGD